VLTGYSPGPRRPHAACQLLQCSVPRAHQRAVRSLTSTAASHGPPEDSTPFGASSAGFSQARGRLAFQPRRPPPRRPLAAVDLPQPDRPEHLLSRVRVDPRLEEQRSSTALRCGPRYRTNPPGAPRLRSAHLVGPPPAFPRERRTRAAAPEVPSTKQPPREGSEDRIPRLATGAHSPTPFRPAFSAALTRNRRNTGSAAPRHWNLGSRFEATAAPSLASAIRTVRWQMCRGTSTRSSAPSGPYLQMKNRFGHNFLLHMLVHNLSPTSRNDWPDTPRGDLAYIRIVSI
jgi:hypothetical protein